MSDLGSLSHCMVDSDPEPLGRARRLHRKAFIASALLEAAGLAAMLLWPLVTLGVLPRRFIFTPAPPIHGARIPHSERSHANVGGEPKPPAIFDRLVYRPPVISRPPEEAANSEPPNVGDPLTLGDSQPAIPGGNDDGAVIHIVPLHITTPQAGPLKISQGVMEALLTHRVQPEYPPIALMIHLSGTVRLHAVIGTDGSVRELEVLSGNPIFAASAMAAVRQWRYQPTRLNGQPVEVETYITVKFILR